MELVVRDELVGAPHTSLNVPIGSTRRFAAVTIPLAEVKAIKTKLGGSVNDVVLAACTSALRLLFLEREEQPPRQGLRAMGIEPVLPEKGIDDDAGLGETRWPVERTLAWLHQNRRLRVRYERRADIHQALLTLACIKICASALLAGLC